jgi:hypothetical protein
VGIVSASSGEKELSVQEDYLLERRFHNGLLDSIGKLGRNITGCAGTSLYREGKQTTGGDKAAKMSGKRTESARGTGKRRAKGRGTVTSRRWGRERDADGGIGRQLLLDGNAGNRGVVAAKAGEV